MPMPKEEFSEGLNSQRHREAEVEERSRALDGLQTRHKAELSAIVERHRAEFADESGNCAGSRVRTHSVRGPPWTNNAWQASVFSLSRMTPTSLN